MKKKMFCLALLVGLLASGTMTASAKEAADPGSEVVSDLTGDWSVTYTAAGRIEDNLGNNINDRIASMQPGDTTTVTVELKNSNSAT